MRNAFFICRPEGGDFRGRSERREEGGRGERGRDGRGERGGRDGVGGRGGRDQGGRGQGGRGGWAAALYEAARQGGFGRHVGGGRHGFGPGGFGDGDLPGGGRKFSGDDLQLLLLSLLAEAPRHGYELIKELEQRSNGVYTPSPGMVYPALTYLEELEYATVELEGNRKRYSLAPAGRAYLDANQERLALVQAKLKLLAKKMEMVRRALAGESADEHGAPWLAEFVEARRGLKRSLLLRNDAPEEEQRRIAAILRRATAEIENSVKE